MIFNAQIRAAILNPYSPTVLYVRRLISAEISKKVGLKWVKQKIKFFSWSRISILFCVIMISNLSESLAKPLVMAKLNMTYVFVKFKNLAKLLLSSLPGRVLRAPGTSSYHLVPKHHQATWSRPEQSHLLPEACSPNSTDNKQQRRRRTTRPPPEPSDILRRFYALYDDKLRYYTKKVSKVYYLLNPYSPTVLYIGR